VTCIPVSVCWGENDWKVELTGYAEAGTLSPAWTIDVAGETRGSWSGLRERAQAPTSFSKPTRSWITTVEPLCVMRR